MDELRPPVLSPAYLLGQVREVGRQDRGRAYHPGPYLFEESQKLPLTSVAARYWPSPKALFYRIRTYRSRVPSSGKPYDRDGEPNL